MHAVTRHVQVGKNYLPIKDSELVRQFARIDADLLSQGHPLFEIWPHFRIIEHGPFI